MKTLILVRHAKSSWDDIDMKDFERPLNKRGKRDAPFMAQLVSEKGIKPDLIISSPAKRAFTTAKFFAEEFKYTSDKIQKEDIIYSSGSRSIISLLQGAPANCNTIFMFGHNPDITYMSGFLSGNQFDNVPTCGVVCIDFDIDKWKDVAGKTGKLRFFEYPKKYFKK